MGAVSEPVGVRRTVKQFVAPRRAILPPLQSRAADNFTVAVTPMISPRAPVPVVPPISLFLVHDRISLVP
jgi:hypothetical protein